MFRSPILSLSLLLCAVSGLHAQYPFFSWVNPRPVGVDLFAVDRFSDGTVIAAGDRGQFILSPDDGETWQNRSTGFRRLLRGLDTDGMFGVMCGDGGAVHRTTDAGRTWEWAWAPTESRNLRDVDIVSTDHYVAVGGNLSNRGVIVATFDGGESWTVTTPEMPVNLYSVSFATDSIGWACGPPDVLLRTDDGGRTWQPDTSSVFRGRQIEVVRFVSATRGIVAGADGFLQLTDDGGASWRGIPGSERIGSVHALCWMNGETIYLSGEREGAVLHFEAASVAGSWRHSTNAQDIVFDKTGTLGITVRAGPTIFRTRDGAVQWQTISTGVVGGEIQGLDFLDNDRGIAVRRDGVVMFTNDAGTTWQFGSTGIGLSDRELRSVEYPAPDVAVFTRFVGEVYVSHNGGVNWQRRISSRFRLYEASFSDRNHGYVSGNTVVYRTTDGGRTWIGDSSSFSVPVYTIHAVDSMRAYAAGLDGMLARTVDGGATWVPIVTDFTVDFFMIRADTTGAITAGWRGGLVHSTDDGVTWTDRRSPEGSQLLGFSFATPLFGVCGQFDRPLLSTTDGGLTWSAHEHELSSGMTAVDLQPSGTGYVGGAFSRLLRFDLSENVSTVDGDRVGVPIADRSIGLDIRPNPVSGRAVILFVDGRSIGDLEIVDLFGRRVLNVTPNRLPQKSVSIDTERLEPGIYYVRVGSEGGYVVRSLVVAR